MKKATNWDVYLRKQLRDPEMHALMAEEIVSLRVGAQIARIL